MSRLNGAELISSISFPPWFQAKGCSDNAGHWRETYKRLKEGEMRQCRTKPILKFLWREGGKWIDEEEGENYKNECVPKIHLEARHSVCGQNILFCSRCCVSGSCVSVSAPYFSPNHNPVIYLCKQLPQDILLNNERKLYKPNWYHDLSLTITFKNKTKFMYLFLFYAWEFFAYMPWCVYPEYMTGVCIQKRMPDNLLSQP